MQTHFPTTQSRTPMTPIFYQREAQWGLTLSLVSCRTNPRLTIDGLVETGPILLSQDDWPMTWPCSAALERRLRPVRGHHGRFHSVGPHWWNIRVDSPRLTAAWVVMRRADGPRPRLSQSRPKGRDNDSGEGGWSVVSTGADP